MANNQEYQKFTLESIRDPSTHSYGISTYDRDINAIIRAVKSALPRDAFYSTGEKEIGKQGKLTLDIYTHKDSANVVSKSLDEVTKQMLYKGSDDERYKVTARRSLSETEQRALIKEELSRNSEADRKDREQGNRRVISGILKIVTSLTVIADITRRILSSVTSMAVETLQTARTARNLGSSYSALREAGFIETAHNLPKGTISGAMEDLRSKFGNITSLDQNALESLAVVMGSDIKSLIMSGMGGDRPEELLGLIVDAFNARANAGYNSVGTYVGEDSARRELYGYLLKISPQIAELFATMQDERNNINSLYRNQFETFEEWKKLIRTNRGGLTETDFGVAETLAEMSGVISTMVQQIKQGIEIKLAPAILALLQKIANFRIFMTEKEKWALDAENTKANRDFLAQIDRQLEAFTDKGFDLSTSNLTPEEFAYAGYRATLLELKEKTETELKKTANIDNMFMTPYQIQTYATSKAVGAQAIQAALHPYDTWDYESMNKIATKYAPEKIKEARDKLESEKAEDIYKAIKERKLEQQKNEFDSAYKEALKSGYSILNYHEYITKYYPKLLSYTRDNYGNRILSKDYLRLSEEEAAKARAEAKRTASNVVSDEEVLKYVYNKYGQKRGYELTGHLQGLYADEIKEAAESSVEFILGQLLGENTYKDVIEKSGKKLLQNEYSLSSGMVNNVYTVVLDVKNDGVTQDDIVLFSATGMENAFQGKTGITYNVQTGQLSLDSSKASSASQKK